MTQRWKMSPNQSMVTDPDGDWVEYSDHLAAIAEKDREIERLKSLVADLTVGCMDNVEVKDDSDG
jgi:hypothetical protein